MLNDFPSGAENIASLCCEHGVRVSVSDLELIVAGASGRVVMRVCLSGEPCGIIGVYWTASRADNNSFVTATEGLAACGVRVPRLLRYKDEGNGCGTCLIEDLGCADLLSLKNATTECRLNAYRAALIEVHRLHSLTPNWPLQPAFDASLYRWEQGYFAEHFLGTHLGLDAEAFMGLRQPAAVAEWLETLPRVPVHRDFQSQNIMLQQDGVALIDYQGMRYGRSEYDLASLVYDPYMALHTDEIDLLLQAYEQIAGTRLDASIFCACALQRLMQALGAYSNIGYNQHRQWYLDMIPQGVKALRAVAYKTPSHSPAYPLAQWLLDHV